MLVRLLDKLDSKLECNKFGSTFRCFGRTLSDFVLMSSIFCLTLVMLLEGVILGFVLILLGVDVPIGRLLSLSELKLCMLSEVLVVFKVFTLTILPLYIERTPIKGLVVAEMLLQTVGALDLWLVELVGMLKRTSSLLDGGRFWLK